MPYAELQSGPRTDVSRTDFMPRRTNWYAVHTRARHEKRVAGQFEEKGIETFLPLLRQVRRWSDRWSKVEVPMFSCYAFVHLAQGGEHRHKVLHTPGVLGFVGASGQGTPIPREEIESLQTIVIKNVACVPHPFLKAGQRVRLRGGALDGMEGVLVGEPGEKSLVVSVKLLQRAVSVRAEGYDFELA